MVCFWCTNWYASVKVVTPIDTTPSLFISWFALHNTPRYMAVWYYDDITHADHFCENSNRPGKPQIQLKHHLGSWQVMSVHFILFTTWPMFFFPCRYAVTRRYDSGPKPQTDCDCYVCPSKVTCAPATLEGVFRAVPARSFSLPPYREDKSHALDCWCSQQKLPADEPCKYSMGSTFRITGLTSAAHNAPSE